MAKRRRRSSDGAATVRAIEATEFPIVGIGASAGGLDAFQKFFDAMPQGSGMAFILIQHLDPTHQSMMAELLSSHTSMKVQNAADGMPIEHDCVYVIPPGVYLSIRNGELHLTHPQERHGARAPFDFFLRSLAQEQAERAICVVLSGTGADGSLGLKAIKEKGGLAIAQDPHEAIHDGMPRSAIMTGAVDLVLPVAKIPAAIAKNSQRFRAVHKRSNAGAVDEPSHAFSGIVALLCTKASLDFTLYKPGTLQRRIERRAAMAADGDLSRYLTVLNRDTHELDLLAKDLLINVTSFFRDPPAFEFLANTIIPELVRRHAPDQPLRIWIAGCSTGEETYSIAMLLREGVDAARRNIKLQIFASDVDPHAVAFAREGVYPASIEADVSPTRLDRFFTKEDRSYRIVPALRELVVFAVQNVLADPPFARLDLISCRNLLIYLRPEAQQRILLLFHFALREGGILFLGGSETAGGNDHYFEPISKTQRIYRHVGVVRPGEGDFPAPARTGLRAPVRTEAPWTIPATTQLRDAAQQLLIETYAPASVVINYKCETLYYLGAIDRYLRVASGKPSRDLLAMAREGLRNKLRTAVHQAIGNRARAIQSGVRLKRNGASNAVTIAVHPFESADPDLLLVSFLEEADRREEPAATTKQSGGASRVADLERELDATRSDLQSTISELERANEEQKAVSEEAMSISEEFQSTNEELVTSKEELQSLNEELTALNSQLQEALEQQRNTSNDLQNILHSSAIATLFLDSSLNIRFFTPAATSLFSVIGTDVGRPLADLTPLASDANLLSDARTVLATLVPIRREIQGQGAAWYIRSVLPYRTHDDRVEGVVITFTDLSERKAAEDRVEAARAYSDSIINTIRQPLLVLDSGLRIISGNNAFYRFFALTADQAVGRPFAAVSDQLATIAELPDFLDRVRTASNSISDCEIEAELPELGQRALLLSGRKIHDGLPGQTKILLAIDDITDRKRAAEALEAAKRRAEQANLGKSRFLAAASHDLRQPLQTLSLLQGLLAKKVKDPDALKLISRFEETLGAMSGMLNTLLDINQLEAGIVRPVIATFPVKDLFQRLRTEFSYHTAAHGLRLHVVSSNALVRSDLRLLEQMMRNLLSNAVKYTDRGKILLGCRRRGNMLRLEVWDTGRGIPEGQISAIFEEFHQLNNPAREHNRGLGLGLAIVDRLAALLGHSIHVRSRPGKGSSFAVEVPLGRETEGHLPPAVQQHKDESTRQAAIILLVEDDPQVREMLTLLLEDDGYHTMAAADGREALNLIARGPPRPDLVIADYNLPNGQTGVQVAARVESIMHQPIPVIILTGDISRNTLREIADHSYVQLNKPVRVQDLTSLIQELLSRCKPPAITPALSPIKTSNVAQESIVFVVDDDSGVRHAIRELLHQNGLGAEVYASSEAFLDAYRPDGPGCLLVDAVMPGIGGFELLEQIKGRGYRLPAIMITGHGDVHMAVRAMQAGAVDFLEKPVEGDELLESIGRALEQMRDSTKRTAWRDIAAARLAGLTSRQREILGLILNGHPNKNIAADLGISQRTVENHRAEIMKKTGSKSLPALVRLTLAAN
jgi:two-component system CheB/CheR fusion protein